MHNSLLIELSTLLSSSRLELRPKITAVAGSCLFWFPLLNDLCYTSEGVQVPHSVMSVAWWACRGVASVPGDEGPKLIHPFNAWRVENSNNTGSSTLACSQHDNSNGLRNAVHGGPGSTASSCEGELICSFQCNGQNECRPVRVAHRQAKAPMHSRRGGWLLRQVHAWSRELWPHSR